MKTVTFYNVWESSRPYLTVLQSDLGATLAEKLGFDAYLPKELPEQWFITRPKTAESINSLTDTLKKNDITAVIIDASEEKVDELGWEYYDGYEFGLKPNSEGDEMIKNLIIKDHIHLTSASIKCFFKQGQTPYTEAEKPSQVGSMTFAQAQIANKVHEKFASLDFIIYTWEESWTLMPEEFRIMLLDHELGHCKVSGYPWIADHDVQEFSFMIKKYNLQLPFFNLPDAERIMKSILLARESEKQTEEEPVAEE